MERSLPDLPNRVFVYGSLKSGLANHDHLIKGEHGMSRYLGPARTREAYPLVVFTKCNVPFLLYAEGKGQRVCGEVYYVDDECLQWLDGVEGHPKFYVREYITVDLLSNDVTGSDINPDDISKEEDISACVNPGQVKCWVYFLKDFPPAMLRLQTYSHYDPNGIHPPFIKTSSNHAAEELQRSLRSLEEAQQL